MKNLPQSFYKRVNGRLGKDYPCKREREIRHRERHRRERDTTMEAEIGLERTVALPTPSSQTSGLQNCERIDFWCFKSPSL